MMMKLPPQVNTAFGLLEAAGYEGFLVGGAVRDYARGTVGAHDWDIATNALPEEVKVVFDGFNLIETGLKHGTVTVVIDGEPLEITTYRIDGEYSDHRRPDGVTFTRSLKEDLLRRDFTINALAYHPKTGIIDFTGGLGDIAAGVIRCVGDPNQRFQEDGLRILRALRFASAFSMKIESTTAEAIHSNKNFLRFVAAERIQGELTKLLCGAGVEDMLTEFADVIAVPLPEIAPMFGFLQHNPHHDKDVWLHTTAVVGAAPTEPILRWAALLHDIGKPSCFSLGADGVGHFYGHGQESTVMAEEILERLRFPTESRERICQLIRYHDLPIAPEKKPVKRLMQKLGAEAVGQLIALHQADTRGQAACCMYRIAEYDRVKQVLDHIIQEEDCFSLKKLAVNGNDMMALGLQGKAVGAALANCLDAVIEEKIPNERTALLTYARQNTEK